MPELAISFEISGQRTLNVSAYLSGYEQSGKTISNYIDFNRGGFDFFIVNNDMIKNDPYTYNQIAERWYARVAVEDLASIEKLGVMVNGCFGSTYKVNYR